MQKILGLLLIICLLAACVKQVETIETFNDSGKLQERFTRKKKDFAKHGTYFKYYPNGKVEEQAEFVNDTLQGQRILFYDAGDTLIVEHYQKGIFQGPYRSYYANGVLESEGNYRSGEMDGQWHFFYKNKQVKEVVEFANNEENGPFVEYHENGKLKAKGTYKTTAENIDGNKEHGPLELYDENGALERKMNCNLGVCRTTWSREEGEKEN